MKHFTPADAVTHVTEHGADYRKASLVQATRLEAETTWVNSSGDELVGQAGDILIDDGTNRWTVAAEIFAKTYAATTGGYRKTATAKLAVIDEPFTVDTLEGLASGAAGDYLALGAADEAWPMPASFVRANYTPVSATAA